MSFKKVDARKKYSEMEKEVLNFWKKNKTFEKSVSNRDKKDSYIFYDGPPFITGVPHYGTLLSSIVKDVVPRFWTMKGKKVERRWGWDCHGLPAENLVEKKLGIKDKRDVAKVGLEKYIQTCHKEMVQGGNEWEKTIDRIGRWVEFKNAYKTMDKEYMESVWWAFKTLHEKGKIYEGEKVLMYCTRCATPISKAEVAMDNSYKNITDPSAYVRFELSYRKETTGRGIGAMILNEKNEILLIKRKEDGRRETWAMPGGKVDEGEKFEEALKREIKEELGVEIESSEPIVHNPEFIEGRMFDTVCYLTKIKGEPKNMVPSETEKFEWFSLDNLPEIGYGPSENAIKSYLKDKNKRVTDETNKELPRVFMLAWTTTPWTLIGNVALAIGKNIVYDLVKYENSFYILAKDRIEEAFKDEKYEVITDIKAEELINLEYEPLFDNHGEKAHKVLRVDFVTTEEGTGIVHIAPAFGEDDYELSKKEKLPVINTVDENGNYTSGKWKGKNVWEVNKEIAKTLKEDGIVLKIDYIQHEYPHCHRCSTKLMYRAHPSWFMNIDGQKEEMLEQNENINWFPTHFKDKRFKNTVETAPDWNLSRDRFWATPIPVWRGKKKDGTIVEKVVGSYAELKELSGKELKDYHLPYVDEIEFELEGVKMKRIEKVMDCWFESGSMPFAQFHYPFENKEKFEENFPGDFISEYVGQVRAWFYYLHAISVGLFGKEAFKNVIVTGTIAGNDGKKMSKSLGNYTDSEILFDQYSVDAFRYLLVSSPLLSGEDFALTDKDVSDIQRKLGTLWQSYSFFVMYANVDNWKNKDNKKLEVKNLLDKWIISKLHELIKTVNENMLAYNLPSATKPIVEFIDELSNWYIRRSRKRFWKSENDGDKNEAYQTLHYVLVELSKIMAPFTPFISEEIYKNLTEEESVHLADFPTADENLIDEKLNDEMGIARNLVTEGLQLRAKNQIKVRQPLQEVMLKQKIENKELLDIIKEELNVKEVEINEKQEDNIYLNTEITPELKLEGQAREIIRLIQAMRKEADFEVDNRIEVSYSGLSKVFEKFKDLISKETLANKIVLDKIKDTDLEKEFEIDGEKIMIGIKKLG